MKPPWFFVVLLAGALLAITAMMALGQTQGGVCPGITSPIRPLASETITVGTSAVGFSSANTALGASVAVVVVETNPIRYLSKGGPTAAVGSKANAGAVIIICGSGTISTWQAIQDTSASGSASLDVEYFGR